MSSIAGVKDNSMIISLENFYYKSNVINNVSGGLDYPRKS